MDGSGLQFIKFDFVTGGQEINVIFVFLVKISLLSSILRFFSLSVSRQ